MKELNNKKTKRNSCLLAAIVTLLIFGSGAYVISREVSDAFTLVDKGLAESNRSSYESNEVLKNALLQNEANRPLILEIEKSSSSFNSFMDSTINLVIINSGGWKKNSNGSELANPRNYEASTQVLVTNGLGDEIEQRIIETRESYNDILSSKLNTDSLELPLKINRTRAKEEGKTWAEFTFDHLPLMAALPMLRKFKNDENESKSLIYRFMANRK